MRSLLICICACTPALAQQTADVIRPGGKVIDCYCTDSGGGRVELGQEICLFVNGRAFMARCEMALNVPIWRDTGVSCITSRKPPYSPRPMQSG